MNLDELRSAQAKERRKDSLQHLRDAFYDDVAAYIDDLRAARDRRAEQVDKPFSDDDVRRMSDEIETAEEVAEALYERRVGKVVKLASFAAADMPAETEGMTSQERKLFDDLVARIEGNKSTVLDVIAGEAGPDVAPDATAGDAPAADPAGDPRTGAVTDADPAPADDADPTSRTDADPTPADDAGALADAMGGDASDDDASDGDASDGDASDAGADDPASPDGGIEPTPVDPDPEPPGGPAEEGVTERDDTGIDDTDRTGTSDRDRERATVRITRDVGEILGVDEREYELASEDVVTLPTENAEPLVQRDAAERLD